MKHPLDARNLAVLLARDERRLQAGLRASGDQQEITRPSTRSVMAFARPAAPKVLAAVATLPSSRAERLVSALPRQAHGVRFAEAPREERYGMVVVFYDLYGNKWDLVQPKDA